jgi:transposase InsO family protein
VRRSDDLTGLVHHSDRGGQYLAIRYAEGLAEVGAVHSVGSRGHGYDNALAETINGLYKTELIHRRGPWRSLEQVEQQLGRAGSWSIRPQGNRALRGDLEHLRSGGDAARGTRWHSVLAALGSGRAPPSV